MILWLFLNILLLVHKNVFLFICYSFYYHIFYGIIFFYRIIENMITLRGKLKKDSDIANSKNKDYNKRVSVRDKLLIKEV